MSSVTIEEVRIGELDGWNIRTPWAEARIVRQGAQLLSYGRPGEPPLVWLSEEAGFRQGTSVRGGIPLCWPWFGPMDTNPLEVQNMVEAPQDVPVHGLARSRDWEFDGVEQDGEDVVLSFHLHTSALSEWPHEALASLTLRIGRELAVDLTTRNLGDQPLVLSQALHTYFAVSDARRVSVDGLQGKHFVDKIHGWQDKPQEGEVIIDQEVDRMYVDVPPRLVIKDPDWQRAILIDTRGSRSTVVWNPWIDKAARLSDFADDAWQRMLCVETAQVLDDVLHLAPGASHRLGVTLSTATLD